VALIEILRFLGVVHRLVVMHGLAELRVVVNGLSEFSLLAHVRVLVVHVGVRVLWVDFEWHHLWLHLSSFWGFHLFLWNLNCFLEFRREFHGS
jgi:hypothetical protein